VPLTPQLVEAWLRGDDLGDVDEVDQLDYETALRILGADTLAKALEPDDVRKSRDLVGKTFVVSSVKWRRSTKSEDGAGRYAVMSCVDEDGVPFITSCGATKVVLQLRRAQLGNDLPAQFSLAADETSAGRTVMSLVAPEAPF
jgi:predicted aspartyl protease